ncbi:glycosyltransferase family 2 protein [Solibacillus sp. FSL K6-1126]|uniref:glycosyltransferase family 2 protein n=1 Tax=Solibacillus sp. FSL K6-1126 TaxID=2921463 RepID=UPI0030FCB2AD
MNLDNILYWFNEVFSSLIFIYMLFVILVYSLMLVFAFLQLRKDRNLDKNLEGKVNLNAVYSKPVSIIVPAYNEEIGIISTVQSLLTLEYPQYEIVIVNDGSKDSTLQTVIDVFQMEPVFRTVQNQLPSAEIRGIYQSKLHYNIVLVDKENGGKADALNAGINVSRFPYFCSIDGDSILSTKSLLQVMKPIVSSNGKVIAAGGSVRIANGSEIEYGSVLKSVVPNNPIIVMQIIEYLRAFYMGRIALSRFNLLLIISGAFSVFSKEYTIKVGGYNKNTIGEDMELVVRLHNYLLKNKIKKSIEFIPDPVCWTEAPDNLKDLKTQRRRWHQGLLSSLMLNRGMLLNPKYKQIGLISVPYFVFIELIGPIVELLGYIYVILSFVIGNIYLESALTLFVLFLIYSTVISMFSILLEAWSMGTYPRIRDSVKLLLYSLSEVFWFRPLMVVFRLQGFWYFIRGKNDWGSLTRSGLQKKTNDTL